MALRGGLDHGISLFLSSLTLPLSDHIDHYQPLPYNHPHPISVAIHTVGVGHAVIVDLAADHEATHPIVATARSHHPGCLTSVDNPVYSTDGYCHPNVLTFGLALHPGHPLHYQAANALAPGASARAIHDNEYH